MKFISFGSGSSGNCYYLSTGTDALLIDVGVGIRALKHNFSNYGISFNSIHNILITHDHADHVKSVGSLSSQYNLPVLPHTRFMRSLTTSILRRKSMNPILIMWKRERK